MRDAANNAGELAAYLIPSGAEALCVASAEGPHLLRCSYSPGRAQPLTRGASALAILAFLRPSEAGTILDQLAIPQQDRGQMLRELEQVRRQKYATSDGALDEGVWGASAPVIDSSGNLEGVVTIMAPSVRAENRADELIRHAQVAAMNLSSSQEGE